MDSKTFYKRQISLSEWFETFAGFDKEAFRIEDNEKRERLRVLNEITGLPYDMPTQFKATELDLKNKKFLEFFEKHKTEFCALRLIPLDTTLPKLRLRGVTVGDVMDWFAEQKIEPSKYRADFIPHSENPLWSTIFISNKMGISGEIIFGMHNQLTQGFYEENKPILFYFDFKKLYISENNKDAEDHLKEIIQHLKIDSSSSRKKLTRKLNAKFNNNFLAGYFETISTKEFGLWFIDYNRILAEKYTDFKLPLSKSKRKRNTNSVIYGLVASRGKAKGRVKILRPENENDIHIEKDDVLVCEMTTPDHVIHLQKVSAIITDKGGVLCHAAIVAREFGIPCIVGTNNATKILKDGDIVEIDADRGLVKILY